MPLIAAVLCFGSQQTIPVHVTPRVELLSIVFRLAEAGEYSMAPTDALYVRRVEQHFSKFKTHPAVVYAKKIRDEDGIGFNSVASFAVHLRPDKFEFKMSDSGLKKSITSNWNLKHAHEFARQLEKFAKDSDANAFFASESSYYRQCEAALSGELAKHPYAAWFDSIFGKRKNAPFSAIPGLLNGGANYGESVKFPDGKMEIVPIINTEFGKDGIPVYGPEDAGTVVHEFCHTYTNGYVDDMWNQFKSSAETLYPSRKSILAAQAYGSAKVLIQESLVRAMTVRFARERMTPEETTNRMLAEHRRGFFWTGRLVDLIDKFQADRSRYPKFVDFMPEVAKFFRREAEELPNHLSKIPKLRSTSIKNGTMIAPGTTTLKIEFDRPMISGRKGLAGATLAPWADGTSGGKWAPDGSSVEFNLKLEPKTDYQFQIGNMYMPSYESRDGYPFEPVTLKFRTSS